MTDLNPHLGVYPGVPMAEYLAWPRYSRSWLAGLVAGDSPRKVHHDQTGARSETAPQAFGTAFHMLVFEPVEAMERIAVWPKQDRRRKEGRDSWAAFTEEHADKMIVVSDDWEAMEAMAANLQADPAVQAVLDGIQDREVSFAWDEPVFSHSLGTNVSEGVDVEEPILPFKCRADAINPDAQLIVDLKTTSKPLTRSALTYATQDFGYAIQAALYPRGLAAHGMEGFELVNVWASTEPPYEVAPTRLDDESLQAAHAATDWALDSLARLDATYGSGIDPDAIHGQPWPGPCTEAGEAMDLHLGRLISRFGGETE